CIQSMAATSAPGPVGSVPNDTSLRASGNAVRDEASGADVVALSQVAGRRSRHRTRPSSWRTRSRRVIARCMDMSFLARDWPPVRYAARPCHPARLLAPLLRRIIAAPQRELPKSHVDVECACRRVRRAHLQQHLARTAFACTLEHTCQ